jgi:hypothetical protein
MKKLSVFSLLLLVGVLFVHSQTQRMVLYEGYSNASCPPCASQNPTTNALIAANPTKVVALKYQTNWPGVDPMNAQTQTWVGPRVSYYSITGVPATRVDGGGTSITQSIIDSRYAVPSPFALTVTHTLNATADSAFVEVVVTAAQAYTGTSLVLHLAMVEKHIPFASAPGTNGETNFYHVMRQMFPNATGTSLQSTWTNAETQTFNFAVAIPTYIYDLNQVAFVAFIQSNGDKSVLQAANNNPLIFNLYPRIVTHNIPVDPTCDQTLNLQVTVKNMGSVAFSSFAVEYGVVGETPQVHNWTGTLAPGQQTVVTLPTCTYTTTTSPIAFIEVKDPNGSSNYPTLHARVQQSLNLISSYNPAPITQGFTSTVFPPAGWTVSSDDAVTWTRATVGGFGNTPGGSARINFFAIPNGKIDYLYAEPMNLTTVTNPILTFSVAHARYASESDRLQVELSTNCGQTWISVYNKAGATLATAPTITTSFTPTAAQWRSDTVSLASYSTNDEVLIRFKATSAYGNNLYLDDINIGQTPTNINENEVLTSFRVFPNPVADMFNVELAMFESSNVTLQVYDITGRLVYAETPGFMSSGNHMISIDASSWAAGLYQVKISTDAGSVTRKIMKD